MPDRTDVAHPRLEHRRASTAAVITAAGTLLDPAALDAAVAAAEQAFAAAPDLAALTAVRPRTSATARRCCWPAAGSVRCPARSGPTPASG